MEKNRRDPPDAQFESAGDRQFLRSKPVPPIEPIQPKPLPCEIPRQECPCFARHAATLVPPDGPRVSKAPCDLATGWRPAPRPGRSKLQNPGLSSIRSSAELTTDVAGLFARRDLVDFPFAASPFTSNWTAASNTPRFPPRGRRFRFEMRRPGVATAVEALELPEPQSTQLTSRKPPGRRSSAGRAMLS